MSGGSGVLIQAAGREFGVRVGRGTVTFNHTASRVEASYGDQRTRLLLVKDGELEVCLISSDLLINSLPISDVIRETVGRILRIDASHVVNFSTHNHSTVGLAVDRFEPYYADLWRAWRRSGKCKLTPVGREFMRELRGAARALRGKLEAVDVCYGEGHEDRISYNRKGRRA
ncbi:MAG: hypothetical protein CMJ49_08505, partial [Planctomycetaceae bacterium]|nr:hypothetical protein [Planctomycetaceae bacterium]